MQLTEVKINRLTILTKVSDSKTTLNLKTLTLSLLISRTKRIIMSSLILNHIEAHLKTQIKQANRLTCRRIQDSKEDTLTIKMESK